MTRQNLRLSLFLSALSILSLSGLLATSELSAQVVTVKPQATKPTISQKNLVLIARSSAWNTLKSKLGSSQFSFNRSSCVLTQTIDPNRVYTNIPLKLVSMSYAWRSNEAKLTFNCTQGTCITSRAELSMPPSASTSITRSPRTGAQGAQLQSAMRKLINLCASDDSLPPAPSGDKA